MKILCLTIVFFAYFSLSCAKRADDECEVCVSLITRLLAQLKEKNIVQTDEPKVEAEMKRLCKDARGKEEKLCYYVGASPTSATYIMKEVTGPISRFLPPEKVCEKLKQKDSQICDLKYDKQIDWKTVDLNKLKVKDLKKILDDWGEQCKACTEKSEFIKRVQELKPKYVRGEL